MSQGDAPVKKALIQVRGNVSAERVRAVLDQANAAGYPLQFSIAVNPGPEAAPAPQAEGAPAPEGDAQDPR